MSEDAAELWAAICAQVREATWVGSAGELLAWDERTYLPAKGGDYRSDQLGFFAGWLHRLRTDSRYGERLRQLEAWTVREDPDSDLRASVRCLLRDFELATRVPEDLVTAIARAVSRGQQIWERSRQTDDFEGFAPALSEIVRLKRQEAAALGYESSAYDPLFDQYEPGGRVATVGPLLEQLRDALVPLVQRISESSRSAPTAILARSFDTNLQRRFGMTAAAEMGFDFQRGRLDTAHHPFCTTLGPHDCRLTTRFNSNAFAMAFFGILHEAGHGIYEQGLPPELFGLPLGTAVSLGVHESQSRLWENFVGRSRGFWTHFFPVAQQTFSESLTDVKLDEFYRAINDVRPSLIRVEADEVTYNLHIIVRFELEQEILAGELEVPQLPEAWADRYQRYLGIRPPSARDGVLQDIHWSAGLIGYFPTYSLGNIYAGMLWQRLQQEFGDLDSLLAAGHFEPLRGWLDQHIYRHGRRWPGQTLIERACGQSVSCEPLVNYLKSRFLPLYAT